MDNPRKLNTVRTVLLLLDRVVSISSGDGRRDERDLSGFDHSSPRVNVLEPVSSRRQLYEWPVAANAAAAAAQAVPASSEHVSLFEQQVREAE